MSAGCSHHGDSPASSPTEQAVNAPAAAPTSPSRLFDDVTSSSGIDYKWEIAGTRPLNILQTIGNGCAFLDYDADGNLDVLLVGPRLALYRGDGKGRFTDVTAESGLANLHGHLLGCAVGDYDNDGFEDVYITEYQGGALLHNEPGKGAGAAGGRLFRDVTREAGIRPQPWTTSSAFVDIDGDGKLDIYLGNYVRFGPKDPQLCDSNGLKTSCGPRFYAAERPALYRNLGGGRFADATARWAPHSVSGKALGIACADFDGSGHQSIALANDEVAGDLLRNDGGRFKNVAELAGVAFDANGNVHGGMGVDWGDYDGDGQLDLVVATFQREAKCLYHNDGGGFFTDKSGSVGLADATSPFVAFGIKFLDFDNDGWLDLIITNGHVQDNMGDIDKSTTYRQASQLFRNVSGASFKNESAAAGPAFQKLMVGRGLAIGDYDNDGRVDALIVDSEGTPMLLHNVATPAGNWLSLRLEGTSGSRDGIGALVTVRAGDRTLLRRCATDGSYMSASDRRVHVGLGTAEKADVTVKWPSGKTTAMKDVRAGQQVAVRETPDGR
jgi:hypothetical protein